MTSLPPTATEWVAQTRSGELSVREGVERVLRSIHEHNPALNAFERTFDEAALDQASRLDELPHEQRGPLHGLPIAVKAEFAIRGIPTTYGTAAATTPAAEDSQVVARLREAGAVIVGTTTMPEFGCWPVTSTENKGVARNPHDLSRTPGGSSGGTAAAVASGMVPVGIGSDGGGSIRIPSSYTGIVGLKPTRGMVHTLAWGELGTSGPLTRTPEDAALIYSVISDEFDGLTAELPTTPRFTVFTASPTPMIRVHPDNTRAVREAAEHLATMGEIVESDKKLPNPTPVFLPHFWNGIHEGIQEVDHPARLEGRTKTIGRLGRIVRRASLLPSFDGITRKGNTLFDDADFLLTPTTGCRPPRAESFAGKSAVGSQLRAAPAVVFTALFNVTGHPAVSVPWGTGRDGLPLAVQVVGKPGTEKQLLRIADHLMY